jgi:peroxiredoxin Q/BCP
MTWTIGDEAPGFTAETDEGTISLKDLRGKRVVLYFYPKDNTPGCTREACDLRDAHAKLKSKGVVVLGVSPDSPKSHVGFKAKHELPFTLVSDPDKAIATAYGVYAEKLMYGKKVMGIVRSTFLIDEHGKIAQVWSKVKVEGHVDAILASL